MVKIVHYDSILKIDKNKNEGETQLNLGRDLMEANFL